MKGNPYARHTDLDTSKRAGLRILDKLPERQRECAEAAYQASGTVGPKFDYLDVFEVQFDWDIAAGMPKKEALSHGDSVRHRLKLLVERGVLESDAPNPRGTRTLYWFPQKASVLSIVPRKRIVPRRVLPGPGDD